MEHNRSNLFYNPTQRPPNLRYRSNATGVAFNPTPPLDEFDDDVPLSRRFAPSIGSGSSIVSSDRPLKDKRGKPKSRLALLGLLTLKEPSQAALKEFAADQKRSQALRGLPEHDLSQKLPDFVPKVNSKWNGMPSAFNESTLSSARHSSSPTRGAGSARDVPTSTLGDLYHHASESYSFKPDSSTDKGYLASPSSPGIVPIERSDSRQEGPKLPLTPPNEDPLAPMSAVEVASTSSWDSDMYSSTSSHTRSADVGYQNRRVARSKPSSSTSSSPILNTGTFLAADDEEYPELGVVDGSSTVDWLVPPSAPSILPKRDIMREIDGRNVLSASHSHRPAKSQESPRSIGTISAVSAQPCQIAKSGRVPLPADVKMRQRLGTNRSRPQWPLPYTSAQAQTFTCGAINISFGTTSRTDSDTERPYYPRPGSRSGLITPPASPPRHSRRTPSRSPNSLISSANAPRGNHIPRGVPASVIPGRVLTRDTDLATIPESDTASILSKAPSVDLSYLDGADDNDDYSKWADAEEDLEQSAESVTEPSYGPATSSVNDARGHHLSAFSSTRSSCELSTDAHQSPRERLGLGSNISYKQGHTPWLSMDSEDGDVDIEFDEHGNTTTTLFRRTAADRFIRAWMK